MVGGGRHFQLHTAQLSAHRGHTGEASQWPCRRQSLNISPVVPSRLPVKRLSAGAALEAVSTWGATCGSQQSVSESAEPSTLEQLDDCAVANEAEGLGERRRCVPLAISISTHNTHPSSHRYGLSLSGTSLYFVRVRLNHPNIIISNRV